MPSIKDHEKRKKKPAPKVAPKHAAGDDTDDIDGEGVTESASSNGSAHKTSKRRPSQVDADTVESAGQPMTEPADTTASMGAKQSQTDDVDPTSFQSFSESDKFELNFPGSFILKAKVPKAFDIVEKIAGDWVNDGKFESLPVGHPLAQILASKALIKAKGVEKKVLGSAPVMLAKIGLEYAKSKIKR